MRPTTLLLAFFAALPSTFAATCKCSKVSNPGLYCGYCTQVLTYNGGTDFSKAREYAFWCAKDGSCDSYGYTTRCDDSNSNYYCNGCDAWSSCKSGKRSEVDPDKVIV